MQDHHLPGRQKNLLQRTAGPYIGSDSDFLPLIGLAVKAGTRRDRTESGRRLKTTHADFLYKQRRRVCTMNHRKSRGNPRQIPWNKGKLIGSKPPLRTKDVWSIRTKLQVEKRTRDLAMFNLAIDSKLRGCDVVRLKVEDVAPHGMAVDRVTVRQRKTGHPVRFELSEQTREAVDDYIRSAPRKVGEFLFPSRRHTDRCLTTRQYSRLVLAWIAGIGIDPALYGTHSLRRTKA